MSSQVGESGVNKFMQLSDEIQSVTTWSSGLEGQLLTLVDAMISDKDQRDAFKSLVRQTVRSFYSESNLEVMRVINEFTDRSEGEKIEYTVIQGDNPNNFRMKYDARKDRQSTVHVPISK